VSAVFDRGKLVLTRGRYVSTFVQNNPTYEYWPRTAAKSTKYGMSFLNETVPVNLFPLTWLLPSGELLCARWTRKLT
jgi:hypothetical protein